MKIIVKIKSLISTKATFTVGPHVLVRCQHKTVEGWEALHDGNIMSIGCY